MGVILDPILKAGQRFLSFLGTKRSYKCSPGSVSFFDCSRRGRLD
jgi:hypothetical protein